MALSKIGKLGNLQSEIFSEHTTSCKKVFNNLSKLYAHLRIHAHEQPYHCPFENCMKSFNQKGNMLSHIQRMHNNDHVK